MKTRNGGTASRGVRLAAIVVLLALCKKYCNHYIASFNYSRFRIEKNWAVKTEHLATAIKASPRYVMRKFMRIRDNN